MKSKHKESPLGDGVWSLLLLDFSLGFILDQLCVLANFQPLSVLCFPAYK